MDIGNKLKELRVLKGLTQEELADRSELSNGRQGSVLPGAATERGRSASCAGHSLPAAPWQGRSADR